MTTVVLSKTHLGSVSPDDLPFAEEMLDKFLHTMEREGLRPSSICLYTDGVRLACQGSPVLLGLQLLEGLGTEILLCGSCVDRFQLTDSIRVGKVSTMLDIVKAINLADRVLYP